MNVTQFLSECVKHNIPISFSKYGDGEYNCVQSIDQHNCDNDKYTQKLKDGLLSSLKYMIDETNNSFIGLWPDKIKQYFWESLVQKKLRWADYHSIILRDEDFGENRSVLDNKIELYKNIKQSPLKKIIICNKLLIKAASLLDIGYTIQIPFNNWFDKYCETVIEQTAKIIETDGNHIVITCCGMGAKVIIYELKKRFPKGIYLDFGSALDLLCTKKDSRGSASKFNYDDLLVVFKDLLPPDWDDKKYNPVYEEAQKKLGVHICQASTNNIKIAKHISFFLSDSTVGRVSFLNRIINEVNTYDCSTVDIFIHVNNDYPLDCLQLIENKKGGVNIVCHDLTDTHPHYLTWKCRKMLKEQRYNYDVFMYIEDDILVPWKAIDYWFSYKDLVIKSNNNLGFFRVEVDKSGVEYLVDINEKLNATITLNDILFTNNNKNPYCGFWIYDKKEFNRFVNSHYFDIANIEAYKIREKSAVGLHGIHSCWYDTTIIPVINEQPHESCKIYHLANNYLNKKSMLFSEILQFS
jgi:hypothetical protein